MSLLRRISQPSPEEAKKKPRMPRAARDNQSPPAQIQRKQQMREMPETERERRGELRDHLFEKMLMDLDQGDDAERTPDTKRRLEDRFNQLYRQSGISLSPTEQKELYQELEDEILGFGPLEALLRDDSITEIMVNGPDIVFVERKGRLVESGITFRDDAHVQRVIDRIIRPLGRTIDRKWPLVDARLPDGSRVNAIIPPCAIDGSSITIRKFPKETLGVQNLVNWGSLTPQMGEFLKACVVSHLNIVVSGGTGSGKTTLLNILSSFIPSHERIVTIEDSAELQLQQRHVVRLETKSADLDGTGAVHIRDLVINSLRMRPDRIIIGECRGGEALDMLQAMNTGHDGSLTTTHSNNPRACIKRLETLAMMSGMALPQQVIRQQIASAVHVIVQQSRLRDGSRKVMAISEVQGMEGDTVVMQDIFRFEDYGNDENGKVKGEHLPLGVRPKFTPKLEAAGFKLPPEVFMARRNKRRRK